MYGRLVWVSDSDQFYFTTSTCHYPTTDQSEKFIGLSSKLSCRRGPARWDDKNAALRWGNDGLILTGR